MSVFRIFMMLFLYAASQLDVILGLALADPYKSDHDFKIGSGVVTRSKDKTRWKNPCPTTALLRGMVIEAPRQACHPWTPDGKHWTSCDPVKYTVRIPLLGRDYEIRESCLDSVGAAWKELKK